MAKRRKKVYPNEQNAENVYARFKELHGKPDKKRKDVLYLLSSYSNFLGRCIVTDPGILDYVGDCEDIDTQKSPQSFLSDALGLLNESGGGNGFFSQLRRHKYREFSRIIYRDLEGIAPFAEIMEELSDLAGSVVEAALQCHAAELGLGPDAPFTVLGMGKLGGRDLNLSSDIDIVYYYDNDVDPEPYFKLAERITKSLSALTEDGFLYRVDIALRPGGSKSPIALSIDGALEHYFYWGDTWERAAMIKARPVAGDIALGERFCSEIEPFVYKKNLDFASIEDLKDMKLKLDRIHKTGDVKLGKGGIREIEFFVQALQLVNAGALPELRSSLTLQTLERLKKLKIISGEVQKNLNDSYLFLRRVEHYIQLIDERQTHRLPTNTEGMENLARMMRMDSLERFKREFESCTDRVSGIYNGLFHEPSEKVEQVGEEFWRLADFFTDGHIEEAEALKSLGDLGFKNPERAVELIETLLDPRRGGLTQKGRSLTKKVIPAFLSRVIKSPDPDSVLRTLERFISTIGLRTNIYAILSENPDIFELLAKLFSTSGFLANFLVKHPEYLDVITLRGARKEFESVEKMLESLENMLGEARDYENKLDILRRFKNVETLKICLQSLNHEVDAVYIGKYLSLIADAILQAGLKVAAEEAGIKPKMLSKMVVLGLGKLGGMEMSYNSDLDIIFVYDDKEHVQYSRWGQRLISVLSIPTGEGFAYKIDTRLRPSGMSGALVSSLDSFQKYHEKGAALWERQALIRSRCSAGNPELGDTVMKMIEYFVYEKPLGEGFDGEIDRIRARMETELAKESPHKFNLKTGRGGAVDIEFIVQMLQLRHGREHQSIRRQNTLDALGGLEEADLIDKQTYGVLKGGLVFLRTLENLLRLYHDRSTNELRKEDFDTLAVEMDLGTGGDELRMLYLEKTGEIREIYESFFSRN